jgi:hypothetical protein
MSTSTTAACSGLANSGVPTKAPTAEIEGSDVSSWIVLAKPRSIIFTATESPSPKLTIMLLGLMSR